VELLLLILKSKRATRTSALKCLDFATSGCPPACDRVVDQQGLKTLFAIFMGKLKVGWLDEAHDNEVAAMSTGRIERQQGSRGHLGSYHNSAAPVCILLTTKVRRAVIEP
jgi:hypothetical protein